jgi:hypothetical protein
MLGVLIRAHTVNDCPMPKNTSKFQQNQGYICHHAGVYMGLFIDRSAINECKYKKLARQIRTILGFTKTTRTHTHIDINSLK